MTRQNAAMLEKLSSAARSLHRQAEVVADAVHVFRQRSGKVTVQK